MSELYETGKWHNWDGKSLCPFDQDTTDYYIAVFDNFYEKGRYNPKMGIDVYHNPQYRGNWLHSVGSQANVAAFYIVSYNKPKEMTVKQVEEALGFPVKIVKE